MKPRQNLNANDARRRDDASEFGAGVQVVKRRRPSYRLPPEVLSDDEVRALMDACGRSATGLRNRALIAMLYRSGLRITEALSLRPKDVDLRAGAVRVLRGKGGRARTVGIDPGACEIIARWLDVRACHGVDSDCANASATAGRVGTAVRSSAIARAPLFCTLSGRAMTSAYIRRLLPRLARKARIDKRVHAHGLRHTHAAQLRAEGLRHRHHLQTTRPPPGASPCVASHAGAYSTAVWRPIHWRTSPGRRRLRTAAAFADRSMNRSLSISSAQPSTARSAAEPPARTVRCCIACLAQPAFVVARPAASHANRSTLTKATRISSLQPGIRSAAVGTRSRYPNRWPR